MKKAIIVVALCFLAFSLVIPRAFGQTQSGSFDYMVSDTYGTGHYTVLYSYPSEVTTGSNFSLTLTLLVDNLTGARENVPSYGYDVTIFSATGPAIVQHWRYTGTVYYYAGSHTDPEVMQFPINSSFLGLSPGQTTYASIQVVVNVAVFYSYVDYNYPDIFQDTLGNVTISDPAPTPTTTSSAHTASPSGAGNNSGPNLLQIGGAAVMVLAIVAVLGYYVTHREKQPSANAPTSQPASQPPPPSG